MAIINNDLSAIFLAGKVLMATRQLVGTSLFGGKKFIFPTLIHRDYIFERQKHRVKFFPYQ